MTNPDARAAAEQALRDAGFEPPNAHGSHYAWTRYNPLTGVYDQVWLDDLNELTLLCVRVPKSALSAILSQQQGEKAPRRYRHWKGGVYEVLGNVTHHEDISPWVRYRKVGTDQEWIRPLAEFHGTVEVPGGKHVRRFEPIDVEQPPRCKRCSDTGYYQPDKHHGQVRERCGCGQGEQPLRGRYRDSLQSSDAVVEQRRQEREQVPPQPPTRLTRIPLQITSPGGEVHGIQLVAVDAAALEALEARIGRVQPPTQQTDPTDDHLQDALGQIADELYLAGLNESRLAPTLQCIEPILRKCLQQQHQRYMAALAELEALPPARSRDYETGYESALGDVRVRVQALTPPGGADK